MLPKEKKKKSPINFWLLCSFYVPSKGKKLALCEWAKQTNVESLKAMFFLISSFYLLHIKHKANVKRISPSSRPKSKSTMSSHLTALPSYDKIS